MFKNIIFFNHWHYGDIFTTREMVKDIQSQLPNYRYGYVHALSPLILKDLKFMNLSQDKNNQILQNITDRTKFAISDDTLFVNTWIGPYENMWEGFNPTYHDFYNIFKHIYDSLNQNFNLNLIIKDSVWDYIPDIDYTTVETERVHQILNEAVNGRLFLICNGPGLSNQSNMGFMENIIEILARTYPQDTFIVTHGFPTILTNIKFTFDIFRMSNDLLEISYISTFADVIVGKNSGPYTYSSTKSNISNPNKKFVCFTKIDSDTLTYGLNCSAKISISDTVNDIDAAYLINQSIKQQD